MLPNVNLKQGFWCEASPSRFESSLQEESPLFDGYIDVDVIGGKHIVHAI